MMEGSRSSSSFTVRRSLSPSQYCCSEVMRAPPTLMFSSLQGNSPAFRPLNLVTVASRLVSRRKKARSLDTLEIDRWATSQMCLGWGVMTPSM
jgi:hypothetical protein